MSSLSEKISLLTNPTPAYLDPEDDVNIETAAKAKKASDDNNVVLFTRSELRSKAAVLLDDSDPAYIGKKVSRQSLEGIFQGGSEDNLCSDDDDEDDDDEDDDDDDDDDDYIEEDDEGIEYFKASLAEKAQSEDEESMDSAASDDEDIDEDIAESTADMVNQFSHIDVTNEIEKGSAVKDQLEIVNRLCEARIRLHKLLTIAHTFPQKDSWDATKKIGGKEMVECMNKASTAAESILNSCLDFQLDYFNRINDTHDEEIPSDTDEENEKNKVKDVRKTPKTNRISKRKLKSCEYADLLSNHHKDLLPYRNSVLQIWDEKTKLSSGKLTQKSFSGFESSVIKQIEQILQDKDRLIKRTQLKRSVYRVMGKPDISEHEKDKDTDNDEPISKRDMLLKDYDPEIFDDDDFYRQFLRDVIESKSVGIDPVSLRKQMEIQNVRSKIKRKVDTKASKGRKIRYDVDPKLTNFAIAEQSAADEARESILKSLCGGYVCSS